ncbi:MAG: hypothetical protein HYX38_27025 [Rhodospirillales bacterium]|nr:hypothetical protein [Rhodospirillales bacterium]
MSREAAGPMSLDDEDRNSTIRSPSPGDLRPLSRWWLAISSRAGYFTVGLAAFYVVVEFRAHAGLLGVRGPDAYWALHWSRDYSGNFVRRGLLGEVLRTFGIDSTDYLVITFLAWSISLALALLLIEAAFRLSRGLGKLEAYLLLLVITMSPATVGLIAETTGDPLQLLLGAYLLLHWLVYVARPAGPWWTGGLFGLFGLIAGLIHEASIFLLFPAAAITACILVRTTASRVAAVTYLLGSAIAVGSVILVTQQATGPIPGGYIHVGAARMAMPDNSFPTFTELLAVENAYNFGRGLVGYAVFAKRLIGSLLIPFFLACLVGAVSFGAENYNPTDRRRVWATFAIPILLSAPLYLIAHDWGRFAGLAFMESLILLGLWRAAKAPKPNIDRVGVLSITLLFAGIMTSAPALESYRINGLYGFDYRLVGSGILFVVAIAVAYRRFWRTQLGL